MITVAGKQWEWLQRKMGKRHAKGGSVFIRKTVKVFSFTWRDCLYTEQAAWRWIISAVRGTERGGSDAIGGTETDNKHEDDEWRAGMGLRITGGMIIQYQWDKLEGYKMKLGWLRYVYAQRREEAGCWRRALLRQNHTGKGRRDAHGVSLAIPMNRHSKLNLQMSQKSGTKHIWTCCFGLAWLLYCSLHLNISNAGSVVGLPHYSTSCTCCSWFHKRQ